MNISCLSLQSILVLCVVILNGATTTNVSNPEIDINLAEICSPPFVCVPHNQCALEEYGANVLIPKVYIRYNDNIRLSDQSMSLPTGNASIICNHLETCCEPSLTIEKPPSDNISIYKGCGLREPNGVYFKIQTNDSTLSQYGEFPWTVALMRTNPSYQQHELMCGGSLIHPSVVLTAAHCVYRMSNRLHEFKVRAGEWDRLNDGENIPHQDRYVTKIVVHASFEYYTLVHDIALLILAEPFILRDSVQTICLPPANSNSDISPQQQCFATGWGAKFFSNPTYRTAIMKKVELPVISRVKCQKQLRQILGRGFILHRSFICAGGVRGEDTCTGDGGSPLVCPYLDDNNRYYQTGIVAGGIGCGEENVPAVYADVARHRLWIDRIMSSNRFYIQSIV